jgi:hypothetical protein
MGIALLIFAAGSAVGSLGVLVYLTRLHALAFALITSAYEIRTKADADREIAAWSKRFGKDFWEESDHPGGDHSYDAQIVSPTLVRLHVVQPTVVTVGITMRDGGQLWSVAAIESTGWYPVMSVWVQEWFDEEIPKRIRVLGHRPYHAWVEFPASLPEDQRRKAFAINTKCLVSRHICKTEEEILPGISQLESTTSLD